MFKLVAIFFLFRQCITFLWKQVVYSFGQCALQNESQVWLIMNTYWGGAGKGGCWLAEALFYTDKRST